ncbi:MAG TPA: MogA/MoaB family molybdenum cofactor biosynthesis protein [Tepidisphaeraceae bacterium]|jgi:molybdenum cofactor biosynthesis protein B
MAYSDHVRDANDLVVRCAVITLSDTRTPETDKSGQRITELLKEHGHHIAHYQLICDEPADLRALLTRLLTLPDLDAIITNGGTGISRRDSTIEVVESLLAQSLRGFGELFRMLSYQEIGSGAMLSRAVGGTTGGKLLFALPGSTGAVDLAMRKLILPELKHLVHELHK